MKFRVKGELRGQKVTYTYDNGKVTANLPWAEGHYEVLAERLKKGKYVILRLNKKIYYFDGFFEDPRYVYLLIEDCLDRWESDEGDVPESPLKPIKLRPGMKL